MSMKTESTTQISVEDIKKLRLGIKKLLAQEGKSVAPAVMSPLCKAAVLVPAYMEDIATLLRPLLSLARQQEAGIEEFEVVVIVNNNRREAQDKSPAYLANQRILKFLRFLSEGQKVSPDFTNQELAAAQEIKNSGLRIIVIDKSSLAFADKKNHVAHARNRGCLEITARFLSNGRNEQGIIAMTDCDCAVSPGYIRSIIDAFEKHKFLNGLCGAMEHEIDKTLPYQSSVKQAFDAHVGFTGRFFPAKKYAGGMAFKKKHHLVYEPLNTGQDMVVPVRSWLLAGGFPDRPSGEDFHFGRVVEKLKGDIAVTDNYTIYPLIRLSGRTGLGGYGGRVKKIVKSVSDFHKGRSSRVHIPDQRRQNNFFIALSKAGSKGVLTKEIIFRLMSMCGCDSQGLNNKIVSRLAVIMNEEMVKPDGSRNYAKMEKYVASRLGSRLPQRDVTHKIRILR